MLGGVALLYFWSKGISVCKKTLASRLMPQFHKVHAIPEQAFLRYVTDIGILGV